MIILAGLMIAASLIAASPAAAAKGHASVSVFCASFQQQATPGYALQCNAYVFGTIDRPAPTGTLELSAASYKGTLSKSACSTPTNCQFTYTPKGKGSDYRKDTVTALYSGDSNYYSGRGSHKVPIHASPPARLQLSCPDSVQTGTTAFCGLSIQMNGPSQFGHVSLKAPTYKGTVAPPECNTFMSSCPVYYTPKGRGYDARVDKITASYAGDLYNSPTKVTETIRVTAAP
jgi:hypothetical protein